MTLRLIINYIAVALAAAVFVWAMSGVPIRAAECGKISWYGNEHHGRRTASGAIFDQNALTAAMPSRKHLGERYRVTYQGRAVTVNITDLGPARRLNRGMDLSHAAAAKLGMVRAGVVKACWEKVR